MKSTGRVCWAFQNGECKRPHCIFDHPGEGAKRGAGTDHGGGRAHKVCYHWNQLICEFGVRCKKQHVCAACGGKHTVKEHGKMVGQVDETVLVLREDDEVDMDGKVPATDGFIGNEKVTVKWDSWCVGLNGQISTALAKELKKKGLARIQKTKRTIRYGDSHTQSSDGVATVKLRVVDGNKEVEIGLKLVMIGSLKSRPILVGWSTIQRAKADLASDEENVLIPTEKGTLRLPKITMREWQRREEVHGQWRGMVNEMIEEPFRNEESIFDSSPTSSTRR